MMKGIVYQEDYKLIWKYDDELIWIEPWGKDSLRVRVTHMYEMPEQDWALLPVEEKDATIEISDEYALIKNGKLTAVFDKLGRLTFKNEKGEVVLKERWEDRAVDVDMMATDNYARIMKSFGGSIPEVSMTFEPISGEKIFGMGQRQLQFLELKGSELELCHKNSQSSIPFYVSNKGYGFLWNNPAVGTVNFAKNLTRWTAKASKTIDYWVTVGDTPAKLIENYTEVTGRSKNFPHFASGFWQSKLRYRTQDELLEAAREYKRRGLPISVIVIDFFHWKHQGDWSFDPEYFPDPKAMVEELDSMGIKLMVSVWPTVDPYSENYAEMKRKGFLTQVNRGVRTQYHCLGAQVFYDPTTKEAQEYMYEKLKQNYGQYGINIFWLDEAEPEFQHYDFDNYRFRIGGAEEVACIYPTCYIRALYDGQVKDQIKGPINLTRSAWAGSQRYNALVWSGDIYSSFRSFRMQMKAGLNAGLSGISWWTSDIGGFWGGDPTDPSFRELFVRWFQFGVFSPICRLHGHRKPSGVLPEIEDSGMFDFTTCGPNEVWSYGEENYEIVKDLLFLRERLRPYVEHLMDEAAVNGSPALRTLFYNYPEDQICWEIEDQLMLGPDLLAAPILYEGVRERDVYLPAGDIWIDYYTGEEYEGGQTITYPTPLSVVPCFLRKDSGLYEVIKA